MSPPQDTAATSFLQQSNSVFNMSSFQLPKRKFPTFSGIMTEWQSFEDLFKSILSHAPNLPDVERFEYLKTSLEGEALSLISHLSLTSNNYHSAWEILKARYGNKRDVARIQLDALLVKRTVKSNDASSIKTQINIILEHIDNLDFITRQWSPLLVHIVEKNLDYDLRARWELVVGDNHLPKVTEFVEFLRTHLRSAEIYSNSSPTVDKLSKNSKFQRPNKPAMFNPRTSGSSTLLATTNRNVTVPNCQLCNLPHSLRNCKLFTDKVPNERFLIAKTHHLCINCLSPGHNSATCTSKYKCQSCNRSHHTLLHFNSVTTQPSTSVSLPSISQSNTTSLIIRGQPQQVCYAADGRRHILRALLDCGSQASFMTEKSACTLMLRRYHSPVTVSTFANTTATSIRGKCTIQIVPSGLLKPSFSVDVSIVPQITGPSPQIPVKTGPWSHINNLPLADPTYHTPGSVDLLLGADMLPSIYLEGMQKGQPG